MFLLLDTDRNRYIISVLFIQYMVYKWQASDSSKLHLQACPVARRLHRLRRLVVTGWCKKHRMYSGMDKIHNYKYIDSTSCSPEFKLLTSFS